MKNHLGTWVDGHNVAHEPTVRELDPDTGNDGFIITTCYGPNARRNARMIATLPDLLAALQCLVDNVQDYEPWQRPCLALDTAKAALAKARDAL